MGANTTALQLQTSDVETVEHLYQDPARWHLYTNTMHISSTKQEDRAARTVEGSGKTAAYTNGRAVQGRNKDFRTHACTLTSHSTRFLNLASFLRCFFSRSSSAAAISRIWPSSFALRASAFRCSRSIFDQSTTVCAGAGVEREGRATMNGK